MKFKLVIMPDGKAILVTPENLRPDQFEMIQEAWQHWTLGHPLIMVGEVVQVTEVELKLPERLS